MGRRTQPLGPDDPEEENQHRLMTLFDTGYRQGSADWQAGRHVDPFLTSSHHHADDRTILSQGWAAGQDRWFQEAADSYDKIARRDIR